MLDSVVRVNKKYYPQTFLEECKYEKKKTKMENLINDDLKSSSWDSEAESNSDNASDNESDNEPDSEPDNETNNGSDNE